VRDSDFRRKVTIAYDRKCCVTGLQLRLIDAAHILPVGSEGSNDTVGNGLCLSPTYHRAHDRGLIRLTEERKMIIDRNKRDELIRLGLGGGLAEFETHLGREIFLPADRRQWPDPDLIRQVNRLDEMYLKGALARFVGVKPQLPKVDSTPYQIYPPCALNGAADDSPLPEDGGAKRPVKKPQQKRLNLRAP